MVHVIIIENVNSYKVDNRISKEAEGYFGLHACLN